ncbi:MAG TPA: c-type cytochrome [Bryobacteraceae bacterium]|nr:c-type cytochrome [Bryobacteraceae bacterium]
MMRLAALAISSAIAALAQTPDAATIERGRMQFQQSCAFCHGADATGAEGPNLILSAVVRHDQKGELISEVIREGRPNKGMPAFPFNTERTADITAFLHARVKESDRRSAGEPGSGYSLGKLNTGNVEAGRSFFAGHCASCHSPGGDLRGVASKYEPIVLQTAFLYPRDVAKTATVVESSGETTTGELIYSDPFTVGIRGKDGWYRSWFRKDVTLHIDDPLREHRRLLGEYRGTAMHDVFSYLETLK